MLKGFGGLTLIELVVVITIIGILVSLSTIEFNNYQVNYNVESEIKTLYSDLMSARIKAMSENRQYVVKSLSPKSYVTAIDINTDGDYTPGIDTKVDRYSKDNLKYDLTWKLAGNTNRLTLDNRGLVDINGSVFVNKDNFAEYDCIVISNTRLKMGKWDGTDCNPR